MCESIFFKSKWHAKIKHSRKTSINQSSEQPKLSFSTIPFLLQIYSYIFHEKLLVVIHYLKKKNQINTVTVFLL